MHGTHVEVSGLRGLLRRSARLRGWTKPLRGVDHLLADTI